MTDTSDDFDVFHASEVASDFGGFENLNPDSDESPRSHSIIADTEDAPSVVREVYAAMEARNARVHEQGTTS
ncbi:hypothetical protein [Rhodococcus sp. BH5]|uniref:hypothetical protein n=1 Tax=Rhodococcus sp. BH5 TaxID=2871702 RepID=UPI0022CDAF1D|nr:hypothetical protein [Rhodococcus sp. BH5]MCZ9635251.1 hypothetical protein [Rhodococcus sp. BH5]